MVHGELNMENNFNGVIPELSVSDVIKTLDYYRDVLGYKIAGQHEDVFGSVLKGKANFYFSKSDESIISNRCYVWTDEVDELCQAFKANGATILEEPEDKPWGYRQFTLQDLNGHLFYYFRFADGVE
jgi:catechol 2,3-dioxygenase-like lactoylglutathione lyase family enzyme